MSTLKPRTTDQLILEAEQIIRTSQLSDRAVRFDFIFDGEGQCKIYQDPFVIVLLVAVDGGYVATYQASDRVFRTPEEQTRFLAFSREVASLQRSIELCLNQIQTSEILSEPVD